MACRSDDFIWFIGRAVCLRGVISLPKAVAACHARMQDRNCCTVSRDTSMVWKSTLDCGLLLDP